MEKVQFEYFVAANWNTLFEGGSIGRGGGCGGGSYLWPSEHSTSLPFMEITKNLPPSHSVPFKI